MWLTVAVPFMDPPWFAITLLYGPFFPPFLSKKSQNQAESQASPEQNGDPASEAAAFQTMARGSPWESVTHWLVDLKMREQEENSWAKVTISPLATRRK